MTDFSNELDCEPAEKKGVVINLRKANKILGALIIIAFVGYLISANSLSVEGFVLKDYHDQLKKLSQDGRTLEVKTISLQSFGNLSERAKEINLVKSNDIEYLTINEMVVAKK